VRLLRIARLVVFGCAAVGCVIAGLLELPLDPSVIWGITYLIPFRRQKDSVRDAALTRSFHRLLRRLKPPPKPVDGERLPLRVIGWVQMDVRFLGMKKR
jgi:hypothetical protein